MGKIVRQTTTLLMLLAIAAAFGTGCSKKDSPSRRADAGRVFIRAAQEVAAPEAQDGAQSKTIIGGDHLDKVYWSEIDQIRVFWRPEGSAADLSGQTFHCFRPYTWGALFSAQMSGMEAGNYAYYAAYPVPESVNGTQVSYTLPAEQDGTYDMRDYDIKDPLSQNDYKGNLDFMLARPVTGEALGTSESPMSLQFLHQCHVMRVQVPVGRNHWGEQVSKLRVEFPAAVVGRMTMDLTNPAAAPQLTEGGNTVTAKLKNPLTESAEDDAEGNYVWLFLCPGKISGQVRFTAYDANGYQSGSLSVSMDKVLEAGKITPVTLTVLPELPVTWIDFSINGNNLGEDPNSLTVTAPEGATFRNGKNTQTFAVNSSNKYSLGFYNEVDDRANGDLIRDKGVTVTYDTENILISAWQGVRFTPETHTGVGLTVPYLLYEDFGGVAFNDGSDDNNDGSSMQDAGLPGWTGSRWTTRANTSLELNTYIGTSTSTLNNRFGRADTPTLSQIKSGKSVKLYVEYYVSVSDNANSGVTRCIFGTTTRSGIIGGGTGGGTKPDVEIEGFDPTQGSYTNISQKKTYTIQGCTGATRLSWFTTYTKTGLTITSKYFYLYLDNVKIYVVK